VDARGHEDVIARPVRVRRHVAQLERTSVAAAVDDGAQAVPHDLYGGSLLLVRDQGHLREQRIHARHLPDYAEVVDDRLSRLDALLAALVDDHLARERIAPLVEDLRQRGLARQTLARLEQAPQLGVFGAQRLDCQQLVRRLQLLRLELLVLLLERHLRREKCGGGAEHLPRSERDALQRVREQGDDLTQGLRVPETRVSTIRRTARHTKNPRRTSGAGPRLKNGGGW